MRAPDFWDRRTTSTMPALLAPLAWFYGIASSLAQIRIKPWRAPVSVICVGNLVAGGAGKTPVVISLAAHLQGLGKKPHIVSRGYGGSESGPTRVNPNIHTYADVGDEPLLLERVAPTWVAKDRRAGCIAAIEAGAEIIIMDDGFQNPSVEKDLSLMVVDGPYGFGNAKRIPAGPLRESIDKGMARADAVILIGKDDSGVRNRMFRVPGTPPPLLRARLAPGPEIKNLTNTPVLAFAGIGRPEKFFETLREAGNAPLMTRAFADHHPYTKAEIDELLGSAREQGARLVTTAKDACRLPPDAKDAVTVVTIALEWDDPAIINGLIEALETGQRGNK